MKVIGHRGAAGLAPENTFAGFDLALEMGIDGIELVLFLVYIAALHVKEDSPRRAGSPWDMTMSMGEALFQPACEELPNVGRSILRCQGRSLSQANVQYSYVDVQIFYI